ncbi:hypothetical protein GMDG_00183 [Pseudogymnoascus destructans 20631-21]|uniref:FAD-binding FR-type domain-containing protein n=1 Tax=Pseudogymnoascus destructans (strain ATCC MYA-4855 / 20631-21) TaxID=658429 RepID=L8FVC9_PSED2|nr:hypothetical protein GMDG_00183 [Pseudogymnoascus destructans 20631-21]
MSIHEVLPFHEGETSLHHTLHIPDRDNPTQPFLSPFAASVLKRSPLIALGALDEQGRPWTTLWGGEPAFARSIAPSVIAIKSSIARTHDPVMEILLGAATPGEVVQGGEKGALMSGLAIDLESRLRAKFAGRMIAGALQEPEKDSGAAEVQLATVPNTSTAKPSPPPSPPPPSSPPPSPSPPAAISLVHAADLFFLSSSHPTSPSTNHRGGPPGFIRILTNTSTELTLVYPEYSGNNLYQTLGNYRLSPLASLLIPDFATGNALYLTGRVDILIGPAASAILPHTNLAIKFTATEHRFIATFLPFRATPIEPSPYNPRVRLLATEQPAGATSQPGAAGTATLLSQTSLSPSISRFRFRLDKAANWKRGQYVVLDFSDELGMGYSHMRDEDPQSLNDDLVRTFTVSSSPPSVEAESAAAEFEITIRKVGRVTGFLFKRDGGKKGLTIPVSGFGGEFVDESTEGVREKTVYIAGGVGITPFLALMGLKVDKGVTLFWTVREADLGLVADALEKIEGLGAALKLFITGVSAEGGLGGRVDKGEVLGRIVKDGGVVWERRIEKEDLVGEKGGARWMLCAGKPLRSKVLEWLEWERVMWEDFDY